MKLIFSTKIKRDKKQIINLICKKLLLLTQDNSVAIRLLRIKCKTSKKMEENNGVVNKYFNCIIIFL